MKNICILIVIVLTILTLIISLSRIAYNLAKSNNIREYKELPKISETTSISNAKFNIDRARYNISKCKPIIKKHINRETSIFNTVYLSLQNNKNWKYSFEKNRQIANLIIDNKKFHMFLVYVEDSEISIVYYIELDRVYEISKNIKDDKIVDKILSILDARCVKVKQYTEKDVIKIIEENDNVQTNSKN